MISGPLVNLYRYRRRDKFLSSPFQFHSNFQSTFPFLPPLFTSFAFDRDGRTAALLPRKVEQPVSEFGPFLQLCISASRAADAFGSISVCLHPPGFLKFIAGSNKEGSGHFVSPFSNGNIFPSGITATGNVTGRGDK